MANIYRVIPHILETNRSVVQQGRGLEVAAFLSDIYWP